MKKYKRFLTIFLGVLSTAILVGCGCSNKTVNPTKITLDVESKILFVNETVDVNYSISPANSSKTEVIVSTSKSDVVELSSTTISGINGKVTLKAKSVDAAGTIVTFTVKDTNLSSSVSVKVYPDPVKLPNVDINNIVFNPETNEIMFRNVVDAASYVVNINGTDYNVTDPDRESAVSHYIKFQVFTDEIFLNLNQGNTVKVKAIGDNLHFADSDWSSEYKFIKLDKIKNVSANNGKLTWDKNPLANRYEVFVNGTIVPLSVTENSYTLTNELAGTYNIKVRAAYNSVGGVNEEGYFVFAGEFSDEYEIIKMESANLILSNAETVDGKIKNSVIKFDAVNGASSYKVKISPATVAGVSELTILNNEPLEIVLDETFLENTNYTIIVTPIGDPANTIEGVSSNLTFKIANKVDNFVIINNVLSFDGIEQSGGYELILSDGNNSYSIVSETPNFDIAENINATGTYTLKVRTLGVKTDVLNVANSTLKNSGIEIIKLNNPVVTKVSNSGLVSFNEVSNALNYAVYLDDVYLDAVNVTNYQLNFSELASGLHKVKVVAIGNGTNIISSGLKNAINYEFSKLPVVTQFEVFDDVVKFLGTEGAINYNIKLNNGEYRLNGVSADKQSYKITSDVINSVNTIYVVAVGDDVKNISSDIVTFEIPRLNAPQNLRVENGKLMWDVSENVYYMVFVGDNAVGERNETGEYSNFTNVNQNYQVSVKAFSKVSGFISSDFSKFNVIKLNKVNKTEIKTELVSYDNLLSNYKLTWALVENATGYNVKISDTLGNDFIKEYNVTENFIVLPEDYAADTYSIEIIALGNSATSGQGYLNSEIETFSFEKLDTPTNLRIKNNVLLWDYNKNNKPASYTVGILYNGAQEEFEVGFIEGKYAFDLTKYGTGKIIIRVRANGNNAKLVTGNYSNEVVVNRLNAISDLKIENGIITFTKPRTVGVTYNVFVNDELINNASIVEAENNVTVKINSLLAEVEYKIEVQVAHENYLYSAKSNQLLVTKLKTVSNFDISNNVFSFDAVTFASGYEIKNNLNSSVVIHALTCNFSEFNLTLSGIYTFNIRAIGSVTALGSGYLTSDYNASGIAIKLVPAPTATITNNKLVITENADGLIPPKYKVEIRGTQNFKKTFESYILELDLSEFTLPVGRYDILIYAIGNDKNIIGNTLPFTLEQVEKLDNTKLNLKIKEGIITWQYQPSAVYDIYVNGELKQANYDKVSIIFDDLIKGQEYDINVIYKLDGAINSDKSTTLKVTKLPDVANFKIINSSGLYKFSWDLFDNTKFGDTENYYFEVVPTTVLEPFNGATESGAINNLQLNFNYPSVTNATFKIKAMGTRQSDVKGYLNGDLTDGSLQVQKLNKVTDALKDNNNLLTWVNPNSNSTGVLVTFTNTVTNSVIEKTFSPTVTSFNVTEELNVGIYNVNFIVLGDVYNGILNSDATSDITISIIDTVTNLRTEKGYITWQNLGADYVYEIYIDGELVTHTVKIPVEPPVEPPVDPVEPTPETPVMASEEFTEEIRDYFETVLEARIINDRLIANRNYSITIRAKTLKTDENYLQFKSKVSSVLEVNKLVSITDLRFDNYLLKWTPIENATGYILKCENASNSEIFGQSADYDAEVDGVIITGNAIAQNGYSLPSEIPSGSYRFYIVALGSTKDGQSVGYLTGDKSNFADTTVLGEPTPLSMENGKIKWEPVAGATKYKISATYGGKDASGNVITTAFNTQSTSVGFDEEEYKAGYYIVQIRAIGNGTTTQNSAISDNSTILVYKPNAPKNFKVVDGFITWEMPYNDEFMMALNDNAEYTEELIDTIPNIIKGIDNSNQQLTQKYSFMSTIEATINGVVYTNLKPYDVKNSVDKTKIILTFDFGYSELKNPYEVKIRYLGNGFNSTVILNDAINEGNTIIVANYVNGFYSPTIKAYKLGAPQSPIVNATIGGQPLTTMISNNNLYFAKVGVSDSFSVNYLITASAVGGMGDKITKTIMANEFLATNSSGLDIISNSIHCVPVTEIGLEPGILYKIDVRAIGTLDSDLTPENESIYLTSYYQNTCEVQVLLSPEILISEGNISFSEAYGAKHTSLKLWSSSAGTEFNPNIENGANGIVMVEYEVIEELIESNIYFERGSYINYILANNPMFKAGSYYVQVDAVGDGIKSITSGKGSKKLVTKYNGPNSVSIKAGTFTWDAVSGARDYLIKIHKTGYINGIKDGETEITQVIVKAEDVLSSDKTRCYYDLPSNSLLYPATSPDGSIIYKYAAEVSVYGSINEEQYNPDNEEQEDQPYNHYYPNLVVNSNSVMSAEYQRLLPPKDINMTGGLLSWLAVSGAVSYEIYKLDTTELIDNYSLISDGDYRRLDFEGLNIPENEAYNLIIRALPGELDTHYLNGEYSIEILTKKLEAPNLRIENGIVKWNTTLEQLAVASSVNLTITGPTGFTPINETLLINNPANGDAGYNLAGIDANYPVGNYTITVSFNGSNGPIAMPSPPEPSPVDEPTGGGTDVPVIDTNEYCWFSSNEVTMTVTKLETPVATRFISKDEVNAGNFVRIQQVNKATKYLITVVKYDNETNNIIKTWSPNAYAIDSLGQDYFKTISVNGIKYVEFDLAAVENQDRLEGGTIQFGTEYSVYAQVYEENRPYNHPGAIYLISNPSNKVAIEIPKAPSNITVEYPGIIRWKNYSENTYTRVKVQYEGVSAPIIYNLNTLNVTEFKLKQIGIATVSILSYIKAGEDEITSSYVTYENPIQYTIYASGSGEIDDPYVIADSSQIVNIAHNLNSHFILYSDILFPTVTPSERPYNNIVIGNESNEFNGTINGNNHSVRGIDFTGVDTTNIAFINKIGETGVIRNLNIEINGSELGVSNFAGVSLINNGTVDNVTLTGEVSYKVRSSQFISGVTKTNNGTISNVYNKINLSNATNPTNMATFVSGIAYENIGTITHSGNAGNLTGTHISGIASINQGQVNLCYNTGNISAISNDSKITPIVGGIVGYNENRNGAVVNAKVTSCYVIINSLSVNNKNTLTRAKVGGIVGNNTVNSAIENSYVVVISSNSVTLVNADFGLILGNYGAGSGTQPVKDNYYHLQGGGPFTTQAGTNAVLATEILTKDALVNTFTVSNVSLKAIYAVDSLNVNNGYPVFK